MATRTITTRLALDGEKEFKNQMASVNSALKEIRSELDLSEAEFKGQANSVEALTAKERLLQKELEQQAEKVRALEQIRDELDEKYSEQVRQAQKLLDEMGYIGRHMLPDKLYEPEDYVSPEEKRIAMEQAAIAGASIDMTELLKYVKPLPMKPWLMTTLRLLFGRGVSQRPQRWDYTVVPQMGGVYDIIMPGGRPDDSWRDAPKMAYDPHPDKHFRR